jgi:hypothetical protein
MCNDYRLHVGAGEIADDFSNIKIKIRFEDLSELGDYLRRLG